LHTPNVVGTTKLVQSVDMSSVANHCCAYNVPV